MNSKLVYFHSTNHPCPESAMNINALKRCYSGNDWDITRNYKKADYIIISTCGFSKSEENYEINTIQEMENNKKQGAEVIVTGCLPQINKKRVDTVFSGKYVKLTEINRFNTIMNFKNGVENFDNNFISEYEYNTDPRIHFFFRARKRFEQLSFIPFVKVPKVLMTVPSEKWFLVRCGMGCTGNCSYCGIKNAHGNMKSESLESIVKEVEKGIKLGVKEISLTGEDQGGYGIDIGHNLADLLKEIIALPGEFKINLRYIDPYWLIKLHDQLMPIFQTGKISAFCSPVQSGSDTILKAMNRRYSFQDVKRVVNDVMTNSKVDLISTNIITGFPGETEEDFTESIRLIQEVKFGMYMVFVYEDRPGVKAATLPNKIPEEVGKLRRKILQKKIINRHLKNFIGLH